MVNYRYTLNPLTRDDMRILEVKIHNILSIEDADVTFEDNGLVLVEGWNYDDGRANGAGKTAIFNAICFGLYGKVPRDINVSEILRIGTKRGYADVSVKAAGHTYRARRERPNKVTFYKDGVEDPMTQDSFESKIKLGYEQFLVSMYTAQSSGSKFIHKNDTQKKDFLLQLMDLKEFSLCKKEAEAEIKVLDKEIGELQIKLNGVNSKVQVYTEALRDPKELELSYNNLSEEVGDYIVDIQRLQKIQPPDVSKYVELEQTIRAKQDKFTEIRAKRSLLMQEYRKVSAEDRPFSAKEADAECPHCQGELNINGKNVVKADDIRAVKKQHEQHLVEIRENAKALKVQIDVLDETLLKEEDVNKLHAKVRDKKVADYSDYDKAVRKVGELQSLRERKKAEMMAIKKEMDSHDETLKKIEALNTTIADINTHVDAKTIEAELLEAVSQLYSSTGAQAYIMDSIVDSFNEVVTKYVDMVWPSASYKLHSYKEKTDGDVVAKFSETLIVASKERSIGSLSGGEQRALSLAIDFAIVDILSKQFGMPLNPIIMDEPFEGLDATGRETVIELLDKLAVDRQIWVVDHASEAKAMFSKTLKIEKRNGVSKIVVQ